MRRKSIAFLMAIVMMVTTFAFQFSAFAATDSGIKVQFQNGNNSSSSNTIAGTYNVTNTSTSPLNLSDVKLRYYFTKDADKAQTFWCDHSGYMSGWNYVDVTNKVKGSFGSVSGAANADTYLEISFASDAGSLPAGGSITIQTRVARNDWSNYDQSNDYSFKSSGSLIDWDHVTAYIGTTLVYGVEPVNGPIEHKPSITPTNAAFDLAAPADIAVTLNPDGATFKGITELTKDTDYTVSGNNVVTIKKEKLSTYKEGTTQTFTFDFGVATKPVLTVKIGKQQEGLKVTLGKAEDVTGKIVTVPITMADVAKAGKVGTFGFNVNYDSKLLEAVKVEAGSTVVNPSVNFSSQINAGSISFLFLDNTIGSELIDKDGVVATITFKIIGTNTTNAPIVTALTFKDGAVFGDATMAKISNVKLTNGSVSILPGPVEGLNVTIGKAEDVSGKTVTVPITMSDVAKAGKVGTFGFNVNYDSKLLEAVKVEAGSTVVNPSVNFSSQINAGSISFLFLDNTIGSELIEKDGVVATITFKIIGTNTTTTPIVTPLTFKDGAVFGDASMAKITKLSLTNGSVSILPGPVEGFNVTIGKAEGKTGKTVTVPVTFTDIAKVGKVGTFGFNVNYDKSLLEAVKVEAGDVVVNPSVNFSSQINAGSISFLFLDNTIGSELIEKDGVVANITFKVLGTEKVTTPLTFKDGAVFGDASMAKITKVTLTNGSVSIIPVPVEKDPTIDPASKTFVVKEASDLKVNLTENGNAFTGITGLTKDTDYTVSGSTVVISKSYLNGLPIGEKLLTFDFSGKTVTLKITVTDKQQDLIAKIGTATGKSGDTVTVPVTLENVAKAGKVGTFGFNVNYDKSLLEAVKVQAGDIVVNPSVNFSSQINAGSISFLFLDNTIGSELIEKDGVVANITFKIIGTNATAAPIVTPVTFKEGVVFGDASMAKIAKTVLTNGSVEIIPTIPDEKDPAITPTTATITDGNASDLAVTLIPNGNTFTGITGLTKGSDYTVSDNALTISKSYLNTLKADKVLEFVFGSKKVTLTIKVITIDPAFTAAIGTATGKAGDTITVPVTFAGVANSGKVGTFGFNVNYDKSLLQAVKVEAGSIVANAAVNFSSQINAGSISFLFLDNTIGSELIEKDGVVANITFKVLGTSKVVTPLTFKDGAVFGDATMAKISKPALKNGSVNIEETIPEEKDPTISIETATFEQGSASDIAVTLTPNGKTFAGITGLTEGKDYTKSENTVTISKSYLNGLVKGTKALTFDFGSAKNPVLTITVKEKPEVVIKGLGAIVGTAAGKAGETVTIPVTLKNVEKMGKVGTFGFTLNFDSTLLEATKVVAGDTVISPAVNFSSQIKAGTVTFLFLDNTIGDQLISSDGVVANITFKVVGSSSATAPITFKSDAVFGDASMTKIADVTLVNGNVKLN